jgi:hypothetical protein
LKYSFLVRLLYIFRNYLPLLYNHILEALTKT